MIPINEYLWLHPAPAPASDNTDSEHLGPAAHN